MQSEVWARADAERALAEQGEVGGRGCVEKQIVLHG